MEFLGQKGMVLSGIALLLVLPALLLSATFLTTVEIGGETTAVQGISDKIAFQAYDIKRNLRYRYQHGGRLDRAALDRLEKRYAKSALIGDISIDYSYFDVWVEYDGPYSFPEVHPTEESETLRDNSCIVKNLKKNHWTYNFEASIKEPDYDYNEPLLRLKRLKNGNWKVTVAPTFTHGDVTADVHWGDHEIFRNVNGDGSGSGTAGAGDGLHEGDSTIVSDTPDTVYIHINLEDPGGTVRYEETFPLRKPEEVEMEETEENLIYVEDSAIADSGPDYPYIPGGVEFEIKNNWDNTVTINQIKINPTNPDINGLSDGKDGWGYNDEKKEVEIYAEDLGDDDGDAYSDFYGGIYLNNYLNKGISIGHDGDYNSGTSPKVESGDKMRFYLYEFYDTSWRWWDKVDMTGKDVTITLTYTVRGNPKKKTFTITPTLID